MTHQANKPQLSSTVLCLAFVIFVFAGAATAQNLVTNAEFNHDITGWQIAADTTDVEIAHRSNAGSSLTGGSGAGSLQVSMSFWNGSLGGCYQDVTVASGVQYTAEASVMLPTDTNNTANSARMRIEWLDKDNGVLDNDWLSDWGLGFNAWLRETDTVVAPYGAVTARLWLLVGTPALDNETIPGIALFDDIVFQQVGATQGQQVLFVPAAAAAAGNNNTYWSTTGWFANQVDFPVQLTAALLPPGQDNTAALTSLTSIGTVPAGGFLEVTDLVAAVGGTGKTGGLYIVATSNAAELPATLVRATTTTFTPSPSGAGVYGQGLPAVPAGIANAVVLPGIFQNSARRTNVGVLNTSSSTLELSLRLTGRDGQVLEITTWTLQPYEQRQTSVTNLGASSINGGAITVTRTSAGGSFRAYLSVVDQSSGDAIYTAGM